MRPILAVLAAALGAALAALIMAEYEFEGYTPWAAGLAVGVLVGEIVAALGRWTGPVAMTVCAAIAAGGVLWGGWLEADGGVEPYSGLAYAAAALAGAVAAWTVRPKRAPTASTSAGS
jgi:hypothetical protein